MDIILHEEKLERNEKYLREVEDFYCGPEQDTLEIYLKGKVFDDIKENKQITYLIKDEDNHIIGYYSLKANAINYVYENKKEVNPFIELSEFAINFNYQRKGYGTAVMLNYIFKKIETISSIIGCQGIMLFALDENAQAFYNKLGFESTIADDIITLQDSFSKGCKLMVISLETIINHNKGDNTR